MEEARAQDSKSSILQPDRSKPTGKGNPTETHAILREEGKIQYLLFRAEMFRKVQKFRLSLSHNLGTKSRKALALLWKEIRPRIGIALGPL
ncbi:hypothetical protein U1Q18_000429 [Sarracenia purpurea var. burkii]